MARYGAEPHGAEAASAPARSSSPRPARSSRTTASCSRRGMAAFLEWYVLERPFGGQAAAPALRLAGERWRQPLTPAERLALAHLAASHRSVFEVETVQAGRAVRARPDRRGPLHGGRAAEHGRLSGGRHPGRAGGGQRPGCAVRQELPLSPARRPRAGAGAAEGGRRRPGTSRDALVFQLSRLHLRWHRQRHIGAARVYGEWQLGNSFGRVTSGHASGMPPATSGDGLRARGFGRVVSSACARRKEHRPRRHGRHLGLQGRRAVPAAAQGGRPGPRRDDARRDASSSPP